jgi:hypothetical protein
VNVTILTIIGIAFTVFLGLWGIYLMVKRKYSPEITFVQESCLGLFDSIVKNMPELEVRYKDSPVAEGLVLLKGSFLNTGSKDISEAMVEEKISVSLPKKYRWLTAKVVSTSPKVQGHVTILDRSIVLETGLFRCNEYIRFEALAEVPTEDPQHNKGAESIENRLVKALTMHHRIADTKKIKKRDLPPLKISQRRLKSLRTICGAGAIGLILIAALLFIGFPRELHLLIPIGDGQIMEVETKVRADGTLRAKGVQDKTYRKDIPAKQFFKSYGIVSKVVPDSFFKLLIPVSLIVYLGFPMLVAGAIYQGHRRNKKLRRLLGISE